LTVTISVVAVLIGVLAGGQPVTAQCNGSNSTLVLVNEYLSFAFAGNIPAAGQFLTPDFIFDWHGPQNLIPIAGTFYGIAGLGQFFTNVFSRVTGFQFDPSYAPATGGVLTVAYSCQFVVKQWQEISTVVATGRPVYRATNTVIYTVATNATGGMAISRADVWIDSFQYATAFCGGQIACFNNITATVAPDTNAMSQSGTTVSSSQLGAAVGVSGAILVLGVINLVLLIILCVRSRPNSNSLDRLGMPLRE